MTLWQLKWMAYGRQRDEWSRWGQLVSLIYNRTGFGDEFEPTVALQWWPDDLVEQADRAAVKQAQQAGVVKLTMGEMLASQGMVTR